MSAIETIIQACEWFPSQYLIISKNVYLPFLYYSHLGSAIPALLVAIFVFLKDWRGIANRTLAASVTFFALWIFCDLVLWATEFPKFTMFFWSMINMFEPFVHFFAFYFVFSFIFKKNLTTDQLSYSLLPLIPVVLLTPTTFALLGYYLGDCDRNAIEGIMVFYGYAVEIIYSILIVIISVFAIRKTNSAVEKKEIALISLGTLAFLISFSLGNIIESLTGNWYLAQSAFFGVPIFASLLAYSIVKFRALNIKLLGTNVFVIALWILTLSTLFVRTIQNIRIVIFVNLALASIVGYLLIRGVKREVELREQLEIMNTQQVETMRFITHEVKGYLTDSSGAFDALLTNSFGPINEETRTMVQEALNKDQKAISEIKEFLRISDFKTGKVSYKMASFEMKEALSTALPMLDDNAQKKHLKIITNIAPGTYMVHGDQDQITNHVISNLINNATNYTPSGSITISLTRKGDRILFSVQDTGVGLSEEDKSVLFTEGGRGTESRNVNPHSTGYGLFIAKKIVEAHGGRIWAESEGRGKGSTFFVELPAE